MDNRLKYFLAVAEELNMHKAADKMFISPQGISAAIKSLEKEYNTVLFTRTPKLQLTLQGESLKIAVLQIQKIEGNLSYIMKNGNDECLGKIVLGVLESRYEVVIPDIVANFKNYHPRVELEIVSAYSKDLEFDTEKKKIDMFIGPSGNYSTELTSVPLIEESFYLLISARLLSLYFPDITPQKIDTFRNGVHLRNFVSVPMIRYPSYTKFYHAIARYEEENNLSFRYSFESNHAISMSCFVQKHIGMAVVPNLFVPRVEEQNYACNKDSYIYAFPILELPYRGTLNLVYRKDLHMTRCHIKLMDIILSVFDHFSNLYQPIN